MNKYLIIIILSLFIIIGFLYSSISIYKRENERLSQNNTTLLSKYSEQKFRDSLNMAEIGKLSLTINELKQYRTDDAKLIKQLKLWPKEIQTIIKTKIETKDSIVFVLKDSCINYKSKWLEINGCLDDTLYINSSDSIVQIFHKEYKHKFLFIKWGFIGVKQKIINFNPKSNIKYSEWIEIK